MPHIGGDLAGTSKYKNVNGTLVLFATVADLLAVLRVRAAETRECFNHMNSLLRFEIQC